ncbi:hypothetical protein A0H81_09410 [Grifola frondosa]|uniref:DOMON domain-containing protein n=1 Tax=Grifola frondosa TaxID=5627 RepID=A0A1C7M154_GRIFR|nr:hypothetical protein A0H81_09410 [Grifola frondosa]
MRSGLALLIFAVSTLVAAHPKDNGSGGDNDAQNAAVSSTASSTAAAASATASGSNSTSGLTGETICMAALMCISAVVNGSTVEYTLQSTGAQTLGWMAMGFGTTMAGSPMVIMWPNSDNSITLSQRLATGEIMPIVDSNPPRAATLQESLSDLAGSTPTMVYTIPANSDTQQNIIWAFGTTNPDDSSPSANLLMHIMSGPTSIDLTKPLSGSSNSSTSAPVIVTPLMPYEKMIVKHAILCVVGFLGLLPAGALLARYLRTFSSTWFNGHWIFQFALACIICTVISGISGFHIGLCEERTNIDDLDNVERALFASNTKRNSGFRELSQITYRTFSRK